MSGVAASVRRLGLSPLPRITGSRPRWDGRRVYWTQHMDTATHLRVLREFVVALDQRVPHVERLGEAEIARDAAELKARALARIAELERELET